MALQYGMNITASDMTKMLEENDKQQSGVRTWRQLFGNASLGYGAQSDALSTDYAGAISQAYASNFAQKNAIMNAGLSAGSTEQMLAQNRNALHAAYQTAMSNYATAAGNIAQSYGKDIDQIQADLSTRAKNFSDLYNKAYEYLTKELYGATYTEAGTSTNGAVPITEGEGKKAKITGYNPVVHDYIKEHGLEWTLNKDGTAVRSWDDLSHELFNEDRTLSAKGREFFDQMFSAGSEGYARTDKDGNVSTMRGFDQWLSDTDGKLRDWWAGGDAYNYTKAGTNAGTAKTRIGLESTDNTYNRWEHQVKDVSGNGSTIGEGVAEFDALKNASIEAQRAHQAAMNKKSTDSKGRSSEANKNARQQTTEDSRYNSAKQRAEEQRDKLKVAFEANMGNVKNDLSTKLVQSVGSANAEKFWEQNKSLLDEYNNFDTNFSANTSSFNQMQTRFNEWYNRVIEAMNAYSKKIVSDSRKTSGF